MVGELIGREVRMAWRRPMQWAAPLGFFLMAACLIPLAVGPEQAMLERIAAGMIWVTALLSVLLGLQNLFEPEQQDGTLELMALAPQPLTLIVLGKAAGFWVTATLPLLLMAPLIGLQFGLTWAALGQMLLSLLIGTPALVLIGTLGAALTLSVRMGGALLALLLLPLAAPVVIFGCAAATALGPVELHANLMLLGACLLITATVAPPATATALRIGLESL